MNYHLSFIILAIVAINNCKKQNTKVPLHQRIEILRNRLKDEIKQHIFENEDVIDKFAFFDEMYDFVENRDTSNKITPIIDTRFGKHNKKRKNKNVTIPATPELSNVTDSIAYKQLRSRIKKKKVEKPLDIFYRRKIRDDLVDEEITWAHCHYMITPYLTGLKKEIMISKKVGPTDPTVVRLIKLLSMDTAGMAKEDIYSILYQISNLHIRLFQWDIVAIKMLLNVVIKEKTDSFKTLKHSIQNLFAEWKLDISNATGLLKQTRIFRPPCVRVSELDGSTKSPRITLYPKKTQPTKSDDDGNDELP